MHEDPQSDSDDAGQGCARRTAVGDEKRPTSAHYNHTAQFPGCIVVGMADAQQPFLDFPASNITPNQDTRHAPTFRSAMAAPHHLATQLMLQPNCGQDYASVLVAAAT
jgi:hypothetical protein